ncbi:MAG: hypothetical protein JXM68_09465, partial [Sedimentisphaerales bacterium]|nr:hypothetical protein [Sedimentisphaerales bacterium]
MTHRNKLIEKLTPLPTETEVVALNNIIDALYEGADDSQLDLDLLSHIYQAHKDILQYDFISDCAGEIAAGLTQQGHAALVQGHYAQAAEILVKALAEFGLTEQTPEGQINLTGIAQYDSEEGMNRRKHAAACLLVVLSELCLMHEDIWQ